MFTRTALFLFLFFACFCAGNAHAQQEAIDMHLEDVGFVMRGASPQQIDRLGGLLPSHKFVARTVSGRRYYVYLDAELCKCVFLGDEAAMQSYKALVSPQITGLPGVSSADMAIEEMNQRTNDSIVPGDILDY